MEGQAGSCPLSCLLPTCLKVSLLMHARVFVCACVRVCVCVRARASSISPSPLPSPPVLTKRSSFISCPVQGKGGKLGVERLFPGWGWRDFWVCLLPPHLLWVTRWGEAQEDPAFMPVLEQGLNPVSAHAHSHPCDLCPPKDELTIGRPLRLLCPRIELYLL